MQNMQNDPVFKGIFGYSVMARDLIEWVIGDLHGAPDLVAGLDLTRLRRGHEQSVVGQPDDLRRQAGDIVREAPFTNSPYADPDAWLKVVLLAEFQRTPDYFMPVRMHNYVGGHYKEEERRRDGDFGASDRLHPVLPLVLYTGRRPWPAARRLLDLVSPPPDGRVRQPSLALPNGDSQGSDLFAGNGFLVLDFHRRQPDDFRDDAASLFTSLTDPAPARAAAEAAALLSLLAGDGLRELRELIFKWVKQESELDLGVEKMEKLDSLAPAQMEDEIEEEVVFWHERIRADARLQGMKDRLRHLTVRKFGSGAAERLDVLLVDIDERRLASAFDLILDCETADDMLAQLVAGGNGR